MNELTRIESELVNILGDGLVHPVVDLCTRLDVDRNTLYQHVFRARNKIARNYDIVSVKWGGKKGYRMVRLLVTSND